MGETKLLNGRLIVTIGDITMMKTDGIVNAANSSLMGGGGVDGAIHRAGGAAILAECKQLRKTHYPDGLPTGDAVVTGAGNLSTRYVIHTVGPVWHGGSSGEADKLASCYRRSLEEAAKLYYIQYAEDPSKPWKTVMPGITAPANRVQWIDSGPPATECPPGDARSRMYRVIEAN